MTQMPIKQNRSDAKQRFEALKLLEEALEKVGDGKVRFKGDHSDATIAKLVGISEHTVVALRLQIFGKVPMGAKPGSGGPMAGVWDRIIAIEKRLDALEDYHTRSMKAEHDRQRTVRSLADLGVTGGIVTTSKANG